MLTVNLINRRSKFAKNRNYFVIGYTIFFCIVTAVFFASLLYVLIGTGINNFRLNRVNNEISSVSSEITARSDKLNKYVFSRFIIDKFRSVKQNKFDYIDYLDQIRSLLPAGTEITGVDFSTKGWIFVDLSSADDIALRNFETNIKAGEMLSERSFSTAVVESITKDKGGRFIIRIIFEIKNNG